MKKQTQPQTPSNRELIYAIISCIPKGNVVYYGQVAQVLYLEENRKLTPQIVGFILTSMKEEEYKICPWQRVIAKSGAIPTLKIGFKGNLQIELLTKEGITFVDNHVEMHKYCLTITSLQELYLNSKKRP